MSCLLREAELQRVSARETSEIQWVDVVSYLYSPEEQHLRRFMLKESADLIELSLSLRWEVLSMPWLSVSLCTF